jgi:hypothetical protein
MAVDQKWSLIRGWFLKITINIVKLGITLAVADRWPLFRGVQVYCTVKPVYNDHLTNNDGPDLQAAEE